MGTTSIYAPYGVPEVTITTNWLANVIVAAIFTTLGSQVLGLRLLTFLLRNRPHGKDDYAMYAAYICSVGFTTTSVLSLRWGVGLKADEIPPGWATEALKVTYGVEIFYYCAIFLVKSSILLLYLRLNQGLGRANWFRRSTIAMLGLLTVFFALTMVVAGVQCVPLSLFWSPQQAAEGGKSMSASIVAGMVGNHLNTTASSPSAASSSAAAPLEGRCIDITAFFYSTNVFTIVTDIAILALPLRTFWRMQMPKKQKISVIGAFLVGGVSTVASCVRLYSVRMFLGDSGRGLQDGAPINTWSFVEIYLGILCASVPAIKPLFFPPKTNNSSSNRNTDPSGGRGDANRNANRNETKNRSQRLGLLSFLGGKRSRMDSALATARSNTQNITNYTERDSSIPLNDLSRHDVGNRQWQRQSGFGLQSAVMTSSQGSLRNYALRSSAPAGTESDVNGGDRESRGPRESSSTNGLAGRPGVEVREGV